MKKKSSVLSVIVGLALVVGVPLIITPKNVGAQPASNSGTASEAAIATVSATLNLDIAPYLGFDCEDAVSLQAIPVYGNVYGDFKCSVISNSLLGYDISITQANNLVNGPGVIPPLGAEAALNQFGPTARYAVNASTTATADKPTWKTQGTLLEIKHPSASPTGDDFLARVGVSVGQNANLHPGLYTGTFTLTLSAI